MTRAVLVAVVAVLLGAAPAHAGQIVYTHQTGEEQSDIRVIPDTGGKGKRLVANVPLGMNALRESAVSRDGRVVAFTGTTFENARTFDNELHYGIWATGLYLWQGGKAKRVTDDPAPCPGCSTFETQPSLTPAGGTLTAETFFTSAGTGSFGRLLARPPGGGKAAAVPAICEDTSLDHPAAAPKGDAVAYVACGPEIAVGDRVVHSVAQRGEFAADTGSPAWSPDGARLAAVDRPGDETTEIWTFGADGGAPQLVLTAPEGVGIRTVAYMGAGRLLFDASFDNGSDLWSVPVGCNACAFPGDAQRVTNNGVSREPAWTPAPVGGLAVRVVRKKLRVTLGRAARVTFKLRGRTVRKRLKAGTSTVRLKGRGRVKVSARGMRAVSVRL